MTRLLENDKRVAVQWLNYSKPLKGIDPLTPLGPNLIGEHLWPVEIDGSRLGLSFLPPWSAEGGQEVRVGIERG